MGEEWSILQNQASSFVQTEMPSFSQTKTRGAQYSPEVSQNAKLEVDHFDLTVSKAMTNVARKMTGQSKTEEPMSNTTSPGRD